MPPSPRRRRPAAAKAKGGAASQFVRRPFSAGPAVSAPPTGFTRSLNEHPSWRRGPLTPAPRAARAARTIQQAFLEAQARQRRAPRSLASARLEQLAAAVAGTAATTLPAVRHGDGALSTAASARRAMETAQHQRTTLLRHMQTPSPVPAPVLVRPAEHDQRAPAAYSARPASERSSVRPAPAPPGGASDERPPSTAPSPRATAAYQAAQRAAQAPHSPRHARPTAAPRRAWHTMSAETPRPPSQPRKPPPAPPPPFALTADEALTMGLPGSVGYSRPGSQRSTRSGGLEPVRPQSRGVRIARPLEHEPPSSLHAAYELPL